nr:hypothetical protein [Rhodoferax sp.]
MRRVAVTGIGVVSPLGNSAQALFDQACAGHSATDRLQAPFASRLAARQALADARLEMEMVDRGRAGGFVGTGMGGSISSDEGYQTL